MPIPIFVKEKGKKISFYYIQYPLVSFLFIFQ